jgi:hypothetical protein
MNRHPRLSRAAFGLGALLAGPAAAEEAASGSDFVFGGEFATRFIAEFYRPSGSQMRMGLSNDSELQLFANYQSWLSVNADMKLERNRNTNLNSFYPDRNTFFRSEGLTLRQLYLTLRPTDDIAFTGGKLHPDFGSGWRLQPGIFYGFATDYEQDERIGFGSEWRTDGALGEHKFSAQVFYLDTSVLSNSLLSRPSLNDPTADRARKYVRWQYGPSNTGSLNSFTLALDGQRVPALPGLQYHLSYTQQATDEPGGRTEQGVSASVKIDPAGSGIPLTPRIGLLPYVEYAHFNNFSGTAGLTRDYVVGGASLLFAGWGIHAGGGGRFSSGVAPGTDYQANLSVTYDIADGFQIGAGVNHVRIGGRSSTGFAPVIGYRTTF